MNTGWEGEGTLGIWHLSGLNNNKKVEASNGNNKIVNYFFKLLNTVLTLNVSFQGKM
jgi:hypothetical protein